MKEYYMYALGLVIGYAIRWLWASWKIKALVLHGDECGRIILKQKRRIEQLESKLSLDVKA